MTHPFHTGNDKITVKITMKENNSHLIDTMAGNFFKSINLSRLEYRSISTSGAMSRNYDPYIAPYTLPDPDSEKHFRTELIRVMAAPMDSIAPTGFSIERFPTGELAI